MRKANPGRVLVWTVLAVACLCGCGIEGPGTGDAIVSIQIQDPAPPAPGTRGVLSGVVDGVRVVVSYGGEELVSQTFQYEDGQGTVTGIPAGGGRVFLVQALAGATVVYQGQQTGVTVHKNETVTVQVELVPAYTEDVFPPAPAQDFTARAGDGDALLTWTATGNDAMVGQAASYDLRWSDTNIQAGNFSAATPITDAPTPSASGTAESHTVPGSTFPGDGTYYFALRIVDGAGNASQVASSDGVIISSGVDEVPPADVSDLAVDAVAGESVILTWTAPGDDADQGTVSGYDVRFSQSAIDAANFDSAQQATGPASPLAAGQAETVTVAGLEAGVEYHFALKAVDDAGNWSGISNVVTATPVDEVPPAAVTDLHEQTNTDDSVTLAWTAPGDNGTEGTAARYDIRYSQGEIDADNFATATQWPDPPAPSAAGATDSVTITSLTIGMEYTFALVSYDEADNPSALSNIARAIPGSTDTDPPTAVSDLAAETIDEDTVRLSWTAPTEDVDQPASAYDIRFSEGDITDDASFDAATAVAAPPAPQAPGTAESLEIDGLTDGVTYHFALKSRDEVMNWSDISNVPSATPADITGPADIQDLAVTGFDDTTISLSWTAPGDDGTEGTATVYSLRYSDSAITDQASWDAATEYAIDAPQAAGSAETATIDGLTPGQHYWVNIRARDDAGAWSGLSNTVDQVLSCTVCPVLDAVRPAAAPAGALVYLDGSQLGAAAGTLTLGGQAATTIAWQDDQVIAVVPAGASGSVTIELTNTAGYAATNDFQITPFVDQITPDTISIPPGGSIVIDGTGFGAVQGTSTVTLAGGGSGVSVTSWSDTSIELAVSDTAAVETGPVIVTVDGYASNTPLLVVGTVPAWSAPGVIDAGVDPSFAPLAAGTSGGDVQVIWNETDPAGTDLELLGNLWDGSAWQGVVNVTATTNHSGRACLAAGASAFHLAWYEGDAASEIRYLAGADDAWSAMETVAAEIPEKPPALGELPDQTVVAAWIASGTVRYATRDPAGGSWTVGDVTGAGTGGSTAVGCVDPAGNFHLLAERDDAGTVTLEHLWYDGAVWTSAGTMADLAAIGARVDVVADDLGGLHAVWHDAGAYHHADWDGTWTGAQVVPGVSATAPQTLGLVVDRADVAWLVVEDDTAGSNEVMVLERPRGAASWSTPVNLSNTAGVNSDHPAVAVSPDLTVRVVWTEADRIQAVVRE